MGALAKFKGGERSILIATDVASRGLDIPSVDVVINYEIPTNPKVRHTISFTRLLSEHRLSTSSMSSNPTTPKLDKYPKWNVRRVTRSEDVTGFNEQV